MVIHVQTNFSAPYDTEHAEHQCEFTLTHRL